MCTGEGNSIALYKHCSVSGKCSVFNKTVLKLAQKSKNVLIILQAIQSNRKDGIRLSLTKFSISANL